MSSNPTLPTSASGTPPPAASSSSPAVTPSLPPPEQQPSFLATAGKAIRELPPLAKAVIAVFLLLVLAAWYVWAGRVSTDDAEVDAHITAVASQVSGYVVALPIDDNMNVKEGDVLVQIDRREYQAEVDQAKATLQLAEAEAKSAELQIGLTRATNERAQADLERYKPLVQTGDVSKFQFDAVDATARVAQNELAAAEQQLAAAQQNVEIARATVNSSKARLARSQSLFQETKAREQQVPISEATYKSTLAAVEHAKAVLEQAELNLGYATIKAPISGQVTQKTVNLGQYVLPGNLLCTLVPLDKVYITANFKETQMDHVHAGQHAKIHVDTYDRDFDGIVDSIAGAAGSRQALLPPQNATGNFIKVVQRIPVKILVRQSGDAQQVLRPGMNVEATIYTR